MITKICLICGKEFQVPNCRANAKYCSIECQRSSLKAEPNCKCEVCGKEFHEKPCRLRRNKHHTCSIACSAKLRSITFRGENNHQFGLKGDKNASFKGKEILRKNGNVYDIMVYEPTHPYCNKDGRVKKHRLVVENHYELFDSKYFENVEGRTVLKKSSYVHHINEDHSDNRIENLMPVTKSEHRIIHNLGLQIIRDENNGRIIGVVKQGELLESPEVGNQQPSLNSNVLEGSETSSRVLQKDSNTTTSALPDIVGDDIVRTTGITNEAVELKDKELSS